MENEFILRAPKGANKKKLIVGRGRASGAGKTSNRGHNGQNSRSGGGVRLGFEGGQTPLYRRLARRGFTNGRHLKKFTEVNLGALEKFFSEGEEVTQATLAEKNIISKNEKYVKILAQGVLTKKLNVTVSRVSASAKAKIEKLGGTVVETGVAKDQENSGEK